MNRTIKQFGLILAAAAALGISASTVYAQDNGYVQAPVSGVTAKDPFGLCWRTGYWTPAMATEECDPELMPKKVAPAPVHMAPPAPPEATPPAARKPVTESVTLSADTLFDFDKSVVRPEGKAKLDALVDQLKDVEVETFIAVGYTDRIGSKAYNLKLSQRRAAAVKAYLVSKGVPDNRIYTEGKGEQNPVTKPGECKGHKSAQLIKCLQPDRRVEIEVIGTR